MGRLLSYFAFVVTISACADVTAPAARAMVDARETRALSATAGVTYFLNVSGNDANPGTSPATAWRSVGAVNARSFNPGDRILFRKGTIFPGALAFGPDDHGTAVSPIVIGTHGVGRATIDGGSGTAIRIYNTSGFEIRNIEVIGSGYATNTGSGIDIYSDLPGGVKLPYIVLDSVEASGFGQFGVVLGSWNGMTGFSDVRMTSSDAHGNGRGGFATYAELPYTHRNVYLGHLDAHDNPGIAGLPGNSGSGIVLGGVSGGTIERSVAHDNGALCDAAEGPVGIWTYDSEGVVIQYNESYANRTNGPADGGGFDLDQNTRNSLLQYNYSHGNAGSGILLAHAPANANHADNTVRYNVSENDGRLNAAAGISVWGRIIRAEIYNNSVYVSPSATGTPRAMIVHNASIPGQFAQSVHVRNNIFYAAGGLPVLWVSSGQLTGAVDLRFQMNDYFADAAPPVFAWGATTYSGLASWRIGSGQEMLGTVKLGGQRDPEFLAPGGGGTIGNADLLHTLTAYQLESSSLLINRGLNLLAHFGISPGMHDFWGVSIAQGSGFDIGAHERQ
ncbi:MAG: right-handed parallel beta-helix repeat-containing protein [Gemmatimonadaceae bacterium]